VPLAVCATPIGNLEDVTLRVLTELRDAGLLHAEDTRRTRVLLDRHGIEPGNRLVSYHEHNEARRLAELLPRLAAGERLALVSDAGMPGINDPGMRLVDAALAAGHEVTVLPGPSAVETALVASGLGREGYRFAGFLPRRAGALGAFWRDAVASRLPVVAFESPKRLPASLAELARLEPERPIAVCRELTKRFEEVVRGPAAEIADRFASPPKGEITLVIGTGEHRRDAGDGPPAAAVAAVAELLELGVPRSRAAAIVGRLTGVPRSMLYRPDP
jgi:16S rRNA (cytidine1402-2'-O)-methyltransferase